MPGLYVKKIISHLGNPSLLWFEYLFSWKKPRVIITLYLSAEEEGIRTKSEKMWRIYRRRIVRQCSHWRWGKSGLGVFICFPLCSLWAMRYIIQQAVSMRHPSIQSWKGGKPWHLLQCGWTLRIWCSVRETDAEGHSVYNPLMWNI